jgi:hypothetical protein
MNELNRLKIEAEKKAKKEAAEKTRSEEEFGNDPFLVHFLQAPAVVVTMAAATFHPDTSPHLQVVPIHGRK